MATVTQTTLVAVFRNTAEAEAAAMELEAVGVHRDRILITAGNPANTYQSSTSTGSAHHEGGIKGWWHSLFGEDNENDYDRSRYESAVEQGNVVLSVDTMDQDTNRIADILNRHSPIDVHEQGPSSTTTRSTERPGSASSTATGTTTGATAPARPSAGTRANQGAANTGTNQPPTGTRTNQPATNTGTNTANQGPIPVVEEELKVGKRSVLRGGVRVYSRVVEEPVEGSVGLREEHVRVERQRVDRPATATDLRPGQEQVIEVKEFTEEPVVSKQARVVEEVRVNKEAAQRTETVRDTVRRTEVDVQPIAGQTGTGTGTTAARQTAGTTGSQGARFDAETEAAFRRDYETNYGSTGQPYDYYSGAYGFGYTMANDPRYRGRNFDEVENDLRTEYGRSNPNSAWDRMKNSVRYGWNRLTNRT
ncbi:MAG TPA: YsnF/AvaK domain-containing protein [Bryobacteraceae bacterium]|jgi:uncharacterized protein (TIGR02271 family)|nr:YsnF/AvaK domain-containing protein [Bryobacteraceae bacterium]